MRTALLALTAVAVLLLGAGAATAAARTAGARAAEDMHARMTAQMGEHATMHDDAAEMADMDAMHAEMHAQMRQTMPAELAERCDELHAQMHSGEDGMPSAMDHQAHHRTR